MGFPTTSKGARWRMQPERASHFKQVMIHIHIIEVSVVEVGHGFRNVWAMVVGLGVGSKRRASIPYDKMTPGPIVRACDWATANKRILRWIGPIDDELGFFFLKPGDWAKTESSNGE